jgi:hypothetical protein
VQYDEERANQRGKPDETALGGGRQRDVVGIRERVVAEVVAWLLETTDAICTGPDPEHWRFND